MSDTNAAEATVREIMEIASGLRHLPTCPPANRSEHERVIKAKLESRLRDALTALERRASDAAKDVFESLDEIADKEQRPGFVIIAEDWYEKLRFELTTTPLPQAETECATCGGEQQTITLYRCDTCNPLKMNPAANAAAGVDYGIFTKPQAETDAEAT